MKVLILGNCGCGKTYLAEQLALKSGIKVVNLDRIMWIPETDILRDDKDIENDLQNIMVLENYIIEGVWGKVMEYLLKNDNIDLLVFIEINLDECVSNILGRISNEENGRIPLEERQKIAKYATNYYKTNITDIISFSTLELDLYQQFNFLYHKKIYDNFEKSKSKIFIQSKNEMNNFITTFHTNQA